MPAPAPPSKKAPYVLDGPFVLALTPLLRRPPPSVRRDVGGRGGFVAYVAAFAGAARVGEAGGVVADHIVEAGGERGRPAAASTAVASRRPPSW